MYFDSHVHFDGIGLEPRDVIDRAVAAGVTRMLAVGHSPDADRLAVALARQFPARLRAAVGLDRDAATAEITLDGLEADLALPEVVAVGEIGLDFHYLADTAPAQEALFARMLDLARRHARPVIVHSRDAEEATLRLLRAHAAQWPGPADRIGVLHCFTGRADFARALLDIGFHISFSGIITFRSASALREVARRVPEDRLLIETDSPYLAPEPHRGHSPNEPALLPHTAAAIAAVRGCPAAHVAALTAANASRLFAWPLTF